jgi:hypothetical protein
MIAREVFESAPQRGDWSESQTNPWKLEDFIVNVEPVALWSLYTIGMDTMGWENACYMVAWCIEAEDARRGFWQNGVVIGDTD